MAAGFKAGANATDILHIKRMAAEGTEVRAISARLRVEPECVQSLVKHMLKNGEIAEEKRLIEGGGAAALAGVPDYEVDPELEELLANEHAAATGKPPRGKRGSTSSE